MLSQIRIYTINKGEMDAFLKHFKEDLMALQERIAYRCADRRHFPKGDYPKFVRELRSS